MRGLSFFKYELDFQHRRDLAHNAPSTSAEKTKAFSSMPFKSLLVGNREDSSFKCPMGRPRKSEPVPRIVCATHLFRDYVGSFGLDVLPEDETLSRHSTCAKIILENDIPKCRFALLRIYSVDCSGIGRRLKLKRRISSVHWVFDRGIFTISDQYEVTVHEKARTADHALFPIVKTGGKQIRLPAEAFYWPHAEALEWHRRGAGRIFSP
jgi:hypothetical protein